MSQHYFPLFQASPTEDENTEHNESTWLSQSEAPVTSLQPLRISHAEADSFFDFDIENESPGSPADECEYIRLVETASVTPHEVATESGYVCASPTNSSQSSSEAQFYDPEASDAERASISGADYYDCVDSSVRSKDSTISSNSSNILPLINGLVIPTISDSDSFSDSLPPSQSTTESNSTFIPRNSNSNSTLQDVPVDVYSKDDDEEEDEDIITEKENIVEPDKILPNGHALTSSYDEDNCDVKIVNIDNSNICPPYFITEVESNLATLDLRNEMTVGHVESRNGDVIDSESDVECYQNEKEEIEINLAGSVEEIIKIEPEDDQDAKSVEDEEDLKPQRLRRCSSLKTGKSKQIFFSSLEGSY
jgi:protein phosphatase 1 regulatory subunit 3A/B/C/D/E